MPKLIAQAIVDVQPMTQGTRDIFNMRTIVKSNWSEWSKKFSFWPRRSITGKLIIGPISTAWRNVRLRHSDSDEVEESREYKWISNKELFTARLKGTA